MDEFITKIIEWTKLKIRLHRSQRREIYFRKREVWWMSLGVNIGHEQNGKNIKFERPAIIIQKFGGETLWIVPLSMRKKEGSYYHTLEYNGKKQTALLSQLRLISSKRLIRKINKLSKKDFDDIINKLKTLL